MKRLMPIVVALTAFAIVPFVAGCGGSDADVASHNLSVAAEQFEVPRQIIAINGITDKYLEVIQGYCSVETAESALAGSLEVTCRVGTDKNAKFYKEFVGLADNVTFTIHQLSPINVSTNHYRVIFKPETIVPNFDRP